MPFHAAAGGLSLMSTWPPARLAALYSSPLDVFTEKTVTTAAGVGRKLEELSTAGVVWTRQEFADDVNGVGAPILGPTGEAVGAINISGPVYRFPGSRPESEIVDELVSACRQIGNRL